MRERLQRWLSEQQGSEASIAELTRIATGNSRAMWRIVLDDGSRLVARVEQGGVFGTSSADEFMLMGAAYRLGCPVARVRWFESTGEVLGQPFFVMDFVDGAATGRNDRSMSDELARNFVARLHGLHSTEWQRELSINAAPGEVTHQQIDRWYDVYRRAAKRRLPLLDEAAAWLHNRASEPARVGLVHGDPGPGNFVSDGRQVVAFTDWEFAHLGDPMEDWAYLVSMRGSRTMSREQWTALFAEVAGVVVSDADLRYWSAFNLYKGACANLTCLGAFATTNRAPNMAIIGTALQQTFMRQLADTISRSGSRSGSRSA